MTAAGNLRTKGATEKDASVVVGGMSYDLPMRKGTVGPDVVDVSTLYRDTGRFTYDPGFTSTASCELKITFIDFDKGIVLYHLPAWGPSLRKSQSMSSDSHSRLLLPLAHGVV